MSARAQAAAEKVRTVIRRSPESPESCTVDGELVPELSCLITPAAYFVSPTGGTSEVTRIYYHGGKFTSAYMTSRVGEADVVGAHYQPEHGLTVVLTNGYRMYVPANSVQASWRVK